MHSNEGRKIMRKTYKLKNLDCANCAAKMELAASKIEGVESITISFISQKMNLETSTDNINQVLETIKKTFKKIEPNCEIEEG